MLEEKQYREIASSFLKKRGWCSLIKDPDIFANFVSEAMIADWKFDGRGTKEGYRSQRMMWELYRTKKQHIKKPLLLSNDTILYLVDNNIIKVNK